MAIDPNRDDLKRFFAEDPGGPVVMLNLLRFVEGGRASYEEYARAIVPHLAKVGGELVYAGACSTTLIAEPGQAWDAVVIVRYPSRQAFGQMALDPAYQAITHLRTKALRETVLQATTPWVVG
jgi:uncharacterized protein (DUF1330 family)